MSTGKSVRLFLVDGTPAPTISFLIFEFNLGGPGNYLQSYDDPHLVGEMHVPVVVNENIPADVFPYVRVDSTARGHAEYGMAGTAYITWDLQPNK